MTIQRKPGSHLYGRGYLGLIPLIGAFVGLGLILLGAIKYQNRRLVLIGFAALFPTILIYGSMLLVRTDAFGQKHVHDILYY